MRTIYIDKDIPRAVIVKVVRLAWPGVAYSPLSHAHEASLPDAPLPGSRWVRVRNQQCGICASDLSLLFADVNADISPVALPDTDRFYLGHEALGHVMEVGPGVTRFRVGDRVMMDTRFMNPTCLSQEIDPPCPHCAEGNYTRCENASINAGAHGVGGGWGDTFTAHETEIYPAPDDLTDDQAMMIEPISTPVRAVLRRLPAPGQHVLIVGGGMIGLSTLQCVRGLAPDCHVTIVTRHPHQADLARRFGADEVVRGEDGYQMTARITHAKMYRGMFNNRTLLGGFDVVYDCVGSARSIHDGLRWARAGGSVVLIGVKMTQFHLDLSPIWHQEVDLIGVLAHGVEDWQGGRRHTYEVVADLMRQEKLNVEPLITHRFPFAQWKRAVATATNKRSGSIKVVITAEGAMKALVIGATGFIGGAIARAAIERGWMVRAGRRDARNGGAIGDLAANAHFEWCPVDLSAVDTLAEAMRGCDVVFHAAGYYPRTSRDAAGQVRLARAQMECVLAAFDRARPGRLVYTSSLSTIGPPAEGAGRLANETDVYRAGSVPVGYFDVKIAMEEAALASGLPVVALCPTAVFGPGDVKPTSGQVLLMVARGLVFVYMDGVQDVVDVRDVAAAHLVAAEVGVTGQRYIVGGEVMTYRAMLRTMAHAAGRRAPWLRIPAGVVAAAGTLAGRLGILGGDVMQAVRYWQPLDTTRARRELSHAPRPFTETVHDALAWFRRHGYL